MKNIAIIVCGGKGKRMGTDLPKQFLKLNNKPIIAHTIEKFQNCNIIDEIVVVINKDYQKYFKEIISKYNFNKISNIVFGGKERFNSVYNGLISIKNENSIVVIHDGVRPFIKLKYIENIIEETKKNKACILGIGAKDTIKICENNTVLKTIQRENLFIIQTPQAFNYKLIKKAYEKALEEGFFGTDDSVLIENMGEKVKVIAGDYENIKITTPEDLKIGEALLNKL